MSPLTYLICLLLKKWGNKQVLRILFLLLLFFYYKIFFKFYLFNFMIKSIAKKEVIDKGNEKVKVKSHTKSQKHDFLLSAKNLYLTYSNCDLKLT